MSTLPSAHIDMPTDVLYEVLEDEVVLLNLETERYYILDPVGTRMWQLLVEHHDPELVVQHLLDEFEVDEASVRNDLAELIEQLLERKLLASNPA